MGVNAQTTVPKFTAGQVLTAAQQTAINTGIPVFATTTTRDDAFGGTGEKVLAEGQFAYIEASNTTQYYDGAAWQTVGGGLTLIKTQTIGSAVTSVEVTNAFSATYDNYLITINGGVASTSNNLSLQLGATTTGYYWAVNYQAYSGGAVTNDAATNFVAFAYVGRGTTNSLNYQCYVFDPFNAKTTHALYESSDSSTTGYRHKGAGFLNNTTSYTAFTVGVNTGTITGGTIRVYGYQNS